MRYRIDAPPGSSMTSPDVAIFAGAAVLGLFIGIGFVIAGRRGRQLWMFTWGAGLVLVSIAYLVAAALGMA